MKDTNKESISVVIYLLEETIETRKREAVGIKLELRLGVYQKKRISEEDSKS